MSILRKHESCSCLIYRPDIVSMFRDLQREDKQEKEVVVLSSPQKVTFNHNLEEPKIDRG